MKYILYTIVLVPVALITFFVIGVIWSNTYPDTGVNLSSVSWLPKRASKINYFRSYSFTAYEFSIPEDEFIKWAKEWPVAKIVKPINVLRYNYKTAEYPNGTATISSGHYYEYRQPNGGGIIVAYDTDSGKAYLQRSPR